MRETEPASPSQGAYGEVATPALPSLDATQIQGFLATIMENTPLMMAYFDNQFRYVMVSRALTSFLNLPARELIGKNFFELFPEVEPAVRPLMEQVVRTGQAANYKRLPLNYTTPEYPETPVTYWDLSYNPVRDNQGQVSGFLSIIEDVTPQVLQEKRLEDMARQEKEHAARLEAILGSISEGICVIDQEGTIIMGNRVLDKLLGRPMLGQNPFRDGPKAVRRYFSDGRLLDQNETVSSRVLRGESFSDYRFWVLALDGQERALSSSGAPIYSANGELSGGVMIFRDVTEQERQRAELEEAGRAIAESQSALLELASTVAGIGNLQSLLDRIVEIVPRVTGCDRVGISLYQPETQEFHQISVYGLPPEQAKAWKETPPSKADFSTPEAKVMFEEGRSLVIDWDELEQRMREAGQEPPPNEYGIKTALFLPLIYKGTVLGMLSLDHNGRPHKFSEREIRVLEGMSQLTSIAIENVRLLAEANQAVTLREANRLKDEFLSLVAHELRNPLTSVQGYTQVVQRRLRKAGIPEQELKPLETIIAQAQRMTRLVEDLLDLSRIETGRLELRMQECDLSEQVRQTVETYEPDAPNHQLRLELVSGSDPATYSGYWDRDRLDQVLTNLVSNAIKYSPEGGLIQLRLERTSPGQPGLAAQLPPKLAAQTPVLHFSIKDNGIGIPVQQQAALFQRFYRADNTRDNNLPGLGLGLYISSQIIALHGGWMWAESAGEGQGSTFHFVLPLKR